MRASSLPTVHGTIANGYRLRTEMAKALSTVQVYRNRGLNEPASAAKLRALFTAGVAALDATTVVALTALAVAPTTSSGAVGSTVQITPTFTPANATYKGLTYVSSNPAVASVSATGLITRLATGTATVTTRSTSNVALTATTAITVT